MERSERSPETIDALSKRRGFSLDEEWLAGASRHRHGKTRGEEKRTINKISRDTEKAEVIEGGLVDNDEIEDWRIGGLRRRGGEKDSASNDVSFLPSPGE